jgi:hypothetical protein
VDVLHRFFHCNKELNHSTMFVTTITVRLHLKSWSRDVMCRKPLQIHA